MDHVYFHCSSANGVLVDRCGTAVGDLIEARDYAACVVRSLTMTRGAEDWRTWVLHVSDDSATSSLLFPLHPCLANRIEKPIMFAAAPQLARFADA
jgi:hypothetical protein